VQLRTFAAGEHGGCSDRNSDRQHEILKIRGRERATGFSIGSCVLHEGLENFAKIETAWTEYLELGRPSVSTPVMPEKRCVAG
jgi:hypothetical protein